MDDNDKKQMLARLGDDMTLAELLVSARQTFEKVRGLRADNDAKWERYHDLAKQEAVAAKEVLERSEGSRERAGTPGPGSALALEHTRKITGKAAEPLERWVAIRREMAELHAVLAAVDAHPRWEAEVSDALAVQAVRQYISRVYLDAEERRAANVASGGI